VLTKYRHSKALCWNRKWKTAKHISRCKMEYLTKEVRVARPCDRWVEIYDQPFDPFSASVWTGLWEKRMFDNNFISFFPTTSTLDGIWKSQHVTSGIGLCQSADLQIHCSIRCTYFFINWTAVKLYVQYSLFFGFFANKLSLLCSDYYLSPVSLM